MFFETARGLRSLPCIERLSALVLLTCLARSALGQPPVEQVRITGAHPELGVETLIVPGEVVYEEHDVVKVRTRVAVPEKDLVYSKKKTVRAGTTLRGVNGPRDTIFYCSDVRVSEVFGGGRICAADRDDDGELETFGTTSAPRKKAIDPPVAYEASIQEVDLDPADGIIPPEFIDSFRKELIFQGAAVGILRLAYREFKGDMIRPAFQQDLTYDIDADGRAKIAFRNVRVDVLSAGNEGLRYKVTQGF